jgi:hypothetical protein
LQPHPAPWLYAVSLNCDNNAALALSDMILCSLRDFSSPAL